jgi:transcription elongation factor/antiterminator RfaH
MAAAHNKTAAPQKSQSRQPGSAFPALVRGERWYVVQTLPCREARAQLQLEAQGFRTFLPRYAKTVRHARSLSTSSAPLFPRYLFVALDLGRHRWRSVNGTFGVAGLLMGNELPLSVQGGVVESLAASCGADGHVALADRLAVGQAVRVLSGPFADMVGKLVRLDGAARVQVLLQLLGGEVPVSVARAALMPALAA